MNVILISIGDEVLLGDTVNTNSAWLGRHLSDLNYTVLEQITVGDEEGRIIDSFQRALDLAELVIVTGGLGPTNDDKTKDCLCKFFKTGLVTNSDLKEKVEQYYTSRGRSISEVTPKMIEVPEAAEIIPNDYGVAPGLWFQQNSKQLIALPGVPFEMRGIMTDHILPRLKKEYKGEFTTYRYFQTAGLGETILANRLETIEDNLPKEFSIAYLPSYSSVTIRLSGKGENQEQLNRQADELVNDIRPHLQDVLYSEDRDGNLVKTIMERATQRQETLAVAESCTGGNIAHQITLVPGSSNFFLGGVVAYANEIKEHILDVKQATLEEFGAVSEQTVIEMVQGTLAKFQSTYAIAVSGIAGPGGGSEQKPVGTVCIAVGNDEQVISKTFTFAKNRVKNIELATMMSLNMLYRLMLHSKNDE